MGGVFTIYKPLYYLTGDCVEGQGGAVPGQPGDGGHPPHHPTQPGQAWQDTPAHPQAQVRTDYKKILVFYKKVKTDLTA